MQRERELTTEKCSVKLYHKADGVFLSVVAGHWEHSTLKAFYEFADTCATADGKILWFADFWALENYDSKVRVDLTRWVLDRTDGTETVFRSKIVAMGVQVARLVAGAKIKVHPNRAQFEHALTKEVNLRAKPRPSTNV